MAAITFDNKFSTLTAGSGGTLTNFAVGPNQGRALLAFCAGAASSYSVTYNSVAMTPVDSGTASIGYSSFFLANPSVGTNPVSVTDNLGGAFCIALYSFYNVATAIDNHAVSSGVSGSQSQSITPNSLGALVVSAAGVVGVSGGTNYSSFSNMNNDQTSASGSNGNYAGIACGDSGVLGSMSPITVSASGASSGIGNVIMLISLAPLPAAIGFYSDTNQPYPYATEVVAY